MQHKNPNTENDTSWQEFLNLKEIEEISSPVEPPTKKRKADDDSNEDEHEVDLLVEIAGLKAIQENQAATIQELLSTIVALQKQQAAEINNLNKQVIDLTETCAQLQTKTGMINILQKTVEQMVGEMGQLKTAMLATTTTTMKYKKNNVFNIFEEQKNRREEEQPRRSERLAEKKDKKSHLTENIEYETPRSTRKNS